MKQLAAALPADVLNSEGWNGEAKKIIVFLIIVAVGAAVFWALKGKISKVAAIVGGVLLGFVLLGFSNIDKAIEFSGVLIETVFSK